MLKTKDKIVLVFGLIFIISYLLLLSFNYMQFRNKNIKEVIQFSGYKFSYNSVNIGNRLVNNTRTIEFWFNSDEVFNAQTSEPKAFIFRSATDNSDNFGFAVYPNTWNNSGGKIAFVRNISRNYHVVLSDQYQWEEGKWYHIAGVIDSIEGMQLFVNGEAQTDSDTSTAAIKATSQNVFVGKWGFENIRYFKGKIAELKFWNKPKNEIEITNDLYKSLVGNEDGLLLYYKFDKDTLNYCKNAIKN